MNVRLLPLLATALAACVHDTDAELGGPDDPTGWDLQDPGMLPPPAPAGDLPLTHTDAQLGQTVDFEVTGAAASETVFFVRGMNGFGAGPCIVQAGGRCLDLLPPVSLLGQAVTDASGTATLSFVVPATAPAGGELGVQAVVVRGLGGVDSVVSDAVSATISDSVGAWCTGTLESNAGSTYALCDNPATWQDAQDSCMDMGMSLTTIDDATETSWLATWLATDPHWWMGYNDIANEGFFEWVDGTPAVYLNWGFSEPNDFNGNEDCGDFNTLGLWNDRNCETTQGYACETDTMPSPCLGTIDYFDSATYIFCEDSASWADASANCQAMGLELASPADAAENAFVAETAAGIAGGHWWIGLDDQATEGDYAWSDGTPTWFTHWSTSQPDNANNEDCVEINHSSTRNWNDRPCGTLNPYICEG